MAGSCLVIGSLAYDFILSYPDRLSPLFTVDATGGVNPSVSLTATGLSRRFGGCAGNIAMHLQALGEPATIFSTVGGDFVPYLEWLQQHGLSAAHIYHYAEEMSAQGFIITDTEGHQITIFHPGAMGNARRHSLLDILTPPLPALAIVSPNDPQGMIRHAQELAQLDIPFIFDPGQALGLFTREELLDFIKAASYIVFNAREFAQFTQMSGLTEEAIAAQVEAMVVTNGVTGSRILAGGEDLFFDAVIMGQESEPTGCGDAYRAGVLYGLLHRQSWRDIGRLSAVVAGGCALGMGGQGCIRTMAQVRADYKNYYGEDFSEGATPAKPATPAA